MGKRGARSSECSTCCGLDYRAKQVSAGGVAHYLCLCPTQPNTDDGMKEGEKRKERLFEAVNFLHPLMSPFSLLSAAFCVSFSAAFWWGASVADLE